MLELNGGDTLRVEAPQYMDSFRMEVSTETYALSQSDGFNLIGELIPSRPESLLKSHRQPTEGYTPRSALQWGSYAPRGVRNAAQTTGTVAKFLCTPTSLRSIVSVP